MQACSEDIKDILLSESALDLVFGTNLFIGREPSTPNNCVTIYDNPGDSPVITLQNDVALYKPSVQVVVRNVAYLIGYNLIHSIFLALHGRNNEVWNSTTYCSIVAVNDPFLLEWDSNGRAKFVCNFSIIRR